MPEEITIGFGFTFVLLFSCLSLGIVMKNYSKREFSTFGENRCRRKSRFPTADQWEDYRYATVTHHVIPKPSLPGNERLRDGIIFLCNCYERTHGQASGGKIQCSLVEQFTDSIL